MADPRRFWLDATAEDTAVADSPKRKTAESAQYLWREASNLLAQTLVPRRPSPMELQEKLPEFATVLYEAVKADLISEEEFWEMIQEYAAVVADLRVRSMLSHMVTWDPKGGRSGTFAAFFSDTDVEKHK